MPESVRYSIFIVLQPGNEPTKRAPDCGYSATNRPIPSLTRCVHQRLTGKVTRTGAQNVRKDYGEGTVTIQGPRLPRLCIFHRREIVVCRNRIQLAGELL